MSEAALEDAQGLSVPSAAAVTRFGPCANVSFAVAPGESFGIVGEFRLGQVDGPARHRRLGPARQGELEIDGQPAPRHPDRAIRPDGLQFVFQDPYASLHPRQTVDRLLREPLAIQGIGDIATAIDDRSRRAGRSYRFRYPHQLSAASASASPSRGR